MLRSYDMGNGIVYHVMNHENPVENYVVVVTVDGKILGGSVAIVGDDRFGYTIGKADATNHKHFYFTVTPHCDKYNDLEVRAVSYHYKNEKYNEIRLKAMTLYDSKNIENVA